MDYTGMTVNERLYVSGLIDEYYKAVEEKDADKVADILSKINIGDGNIRSILEKYGLQI